MTAENRETWNFPVVGCDSRDVPKYLFFTDTFEKAKAFCAKAETTGWRRVAVFDAMLKEVKSPMR